MKIEGFHIDGYGVHHDLSANGLPHGLTIIAGPNEAGKTTLQHFLVGMLFGFTASNRPDHHAPLRGGTYGGRLLVSDDDGRTLTIHRGGRRSSLHITSTEGPVADAELTDLLGGATKDLFESIFAVHLDELAELKALSDEQVRDRVFSAGILGAGKTAQRALGQLADERDGLLKPGGRSPDKYLIKKLSADLVGARGQLAEVRRSATGLPAISQRLSTLDLDRQRVRDERDGLDAQRTMLRAVVDLWPAWTSAAEARAELDQLGAVPAVAPDAAEQLRRAAERHDDLATVVAHAAEALSGATSALDAIDGPGPALLHEAAINDLVVVAPVERQRLVAAGEQATTTEGFERDLVALLAELGHGGDEAWLATQPERPDAGAELRHAAARVTAAQQHHHHLIDLHRRATTDLDDEQAALDAAETQLAEGPHHPIGQAREAVENASLLVSMVGQRDDARRRPAAARPAPTPLLPLGIMLTFAGGVGIAAGLAIPGALALGCGVALVALALLARQPGAVSSVHTNQEIADIDCTLAPVLAALGLTEAPPLAHAINLRTRAEQLATEAVQLDRDRHQLVERRRALAARIARHRDRQGTEQAAAETELLEALQGWAASLATQGLPTTLDATAATQVLDTIRRAHSVHRSLVTARADRNRSLTLHQSYANRVAAVANTVGLPMPIDPLATVEELRVALQRDVQARTRIAEATIVIDAARQAHGVAHERSRAAAAELTEVLSALAAPTVAHARTIIERATQASTLRDTVHRADRDLATKVGTRPDRLDQARTLLAQADPTRWNDEFRRLEAALADTDDRIDASTTEIAHLAREREEIERSADVPSCELYVADLEAQLVEAVTRWASVTVAHQLVEGTLARYQRERQPDVVKRAAARFEQITAGRYPRLEVRGQEIVAIDHAEREVPAGALSQGSVEQLYLCMRFALAESFARTARLPLLLDDIIVNADGVRTPKLAQTIASIANEQQVFVFTCHDATVDLLQAAAPHARLVTLAPSAALRPLGHAAG